MLTWGAWRIAKEIGVLAWRVGIKVIKGLRKTDTEWTLGKFKSDTRWRNQMEKRGWTTKEITEAIEKGEDFIRPEIPGKKELIMSSTTVKVYVRLLEEGTETARGTQAIALGGDLYRLEATPHYDPEDEIWEFLPGSLVKCIHAKDHHGNDILLAIEKKDDSSEYIIT